MFQLAVQEKGGIMSRVEKRKQILIVNYEFPPLGGGGGVAAKKLAQGFIENGYEVDYLTTWFKGLKKYEKVDGINVYRIKVIGRKELPIASMISLYSFPLLALPVGIKLCAKNNYEFINSHFVVPSGVLGFLLSKVFKIRHVLSIHGGDIYDPSKTKSPHKNSIFKIFIRFLIDNADVIVAQSDNTKSNASRYYGISREIEVIPLPYKKIYFRKANRINLSMDKKNKYIIGVGRLVKRKGFDFFLKTLAKLPTNVIGIILGDGPERDSLIKLANDLELNERLIMPGLVSEEKKMQYLDNSDLFFLSSIHEGFGIALQEAIQAGLPIIATNNGGQSDFIKENFLIKYGDIKTATHKICLLLNNKEKQICIKKNTSFETEKIINKYLSLIYEKK